MIKHFYFIEPSNAAVMVWIHGGGFSTGAGSIYGRYGTSLVAVGQDVMVVTLNYRLMVWSVFNTGKKVIRNSVHNVAGRIQFSVI